MYVGHGRGSLVAYALLFGPVLLIASLVLTWRELRYLTSGAVTDAQVLRVRENDDPRRQRTASFTIEYRFTDNGVVRTEEDTVASLDGWPFKQNRALIMVQYLPGAEDRSRIAGHRRWWAAIPLVVVVIGMAAVLGKALLIYRKDQQYMAMRSGRGLI